MAKRPGETKAQLREKLAAVLRDLMVEVDGKLVRAIPYEHAKQMSADQVISLFHFDHGIHHTIGGSAAHWNLTARFIKEHRAKTSEVDRPRIDKTKRIVEGQEAFRARMLAKTGVPIDASKNPAKSKAKLESRGFQGHRKFDGTIVRKDKR